MLSTNSSPTRDDILRTLESIRQARQPNGVKPYMMPVNDYKTYLPKTIGYNAPDISPYYTMADTINQTGVEATNIAMVHAQNRALYQQMLDARRQANQAARAAARAANYHPHYNFNYSGGSGNGGGGGNHNNGSVGSLPQPGHYAKFNPNAPYKTYHWHQFSLTFNSSVAGRFIGFLNALYKRGYHPKVIGSYRPGSRIYPGGPLDLHSMALAMDIDPSRNPVTWNGHNITALPRGVGALAARYGLKWGGSWIHNKRDTMHFSYPYANLE